MPYRVCISLCRGPYGTASCYMCQCTPNIIPAGLNIFKHKRYFFFCSRIAMGCFETGMVIGLATVTSQNRYRLTIWTWPWSKYLERPTHTPTTRKYRNRGSSLGETFLWFHCYLLHISCDRCIGIYDWTQFGLHDAAIKWKYFPCYWPFVRESPGHQWIPLTKTSGAELWWFLWSAPEQTVE